MAVTALGILGSDGAGRPILPLTRATRDALAAYVAINAPTGRRKWAMARWGLTSDQARAVAEGNPSASTIDQIWKHPNGGWAVLLPVMGAVVGQPIHEFFREQIRNAADEQARAAEHERLASAAYARLADRLVLDPDPLRDGASEPGNTAGAVGPEAPRRLGRT